MKRRAGPRIEPGLAKRQARGLVFARDLTATLRRREVGPVGEPIAAVTGRPLNPLAPDECLAGTDRRRFAMIDHGPGFQLVAWTRSLDRRLGRHVSGVARDDGGVDWDFGRKRALGL